jgi:TolB-like protein
VAGIHQNHEAALDGGRTTDTLTARNQRLGPCLLDTGRGLLQRADGTETMLRPKSLELLLFLLRNRGRVVGRAEILETVWPKVFVSDDSVTQCIVDIRKALGPSGLALLRTLPRRGYLLEVGPEEETATGRLQADGRPSIAVLPFRKDYADPEEAYFADGIIEGIVHVLSGLEQIFVVSRSSSLAVAKTTVEARAAGRELGVGYVLYGGVRRSGNRLRIATELSETEGGAIIRSDRYDGEVAELFDLQDRIALQVITTIAPQVRQHELTRALRKPPASLTAYDLVLKALDRLHRLDHVALDEAAALLRRAVESDPGFALAQTTIAWLHVLRIAQGSTQDIAAEAEAAARAAAIAIEHDRNDAMAKAIRGFVLAYTRHDFAPALRLLDDAVATSPSCALAWSYGAALRCWLDAGVEAVEWAKRGLRLAPHDPFTFLHEHILSQALHGAGEMQEAVIWARRSIASNPHHSPSWRVLAASLVALGEETEAMAAARRMHELEPGFSLRILAARTPLQGTARTTFIDRLRRAGVRD